MPQGSQSVCPEDTDYECTTACDCGPAHACLAVDRDGNQRCVKDEADPWNTTGTNIFGVLIPVGEPTYCCDESECFAAALAWKQASMSDFSCWSEGTESASATCGGDPCFYSGDCSSAEECVDAETWHAEGSTDVVPGTLCSLDGGRCVSNAVAEFVFGYSSAELLPACSRTSGPPYSKKCQVGWEPGGAYAISRIAAPPGACGDDVCDSDKGEWATNCHDCFCGDGVCDTSEPGDCTVDCGYCGDAYCDELETRKSCFEDCGRFEPVCGDGSCEPSEVESCTTDCGCDVSPYLSDFAAACGDAVCQRIGDVPENCVSCSSDCDAETELILTSTLVTGSLVATACDWVRVADAGVADTGTLEISSGTGVEIDDDFEVAAEGWLKVDSGEPAAP